MRALPRTTELCGEKIAADAGFWPFSITDGGRSIAFVRATRDQLAREPFLDARMSVALNAPKSFAVSVFLEKPIPAASGAADYIFHNGFCGSTLLASLLDADGFNLSLKEPHILAQLAQAKRRLGMAATDRVPSGPLFDCMDVANRLLERRHQAAETVVIKPSNIVNNLIPDLLERGGHALFVYGPLDDFLRSIVRRGEEGRVFTRRLWATMRADSPAFSLLPSSQMVSLTDLQVGALAWHGQLSLFRDLLATLPQGRAASLNYLDLIASPHRVLARVAHFLWPSRDVDDCSRFGIDDKLRSDSKSGADRAELERRERLTARDEAVVQDVLTWLAALEGCVLEARLSNDVGGSR